MKRRDFNKLLSAAVAGMFAGGALSGCKTSGGTSDMAAVEPHACRGLNSCKGQGAGGGNGCAGQGECATVEPPQLRRKQQVQEPGRLRRDARGERVFREGEVRHTPEGPRFGQSSRQL